MKKIKKVLALALVAALGVASLTGCGKGNSGKSGSETDIEIAYWHSGLGIDWLNNMVEAFEEKYPQYSVTIKSSADYSAVKAPFGNENTDTIDLYMANAEYNHEYSESLNDVLDSQIKGESKKIREKLDPAYLELEMADDGNAYELTYGGGVIGIVYNKKLFKQAGIDEVPRTTNELVNVCDTLYGDNIVPFCHFKNASYWIYASDAWRMQYDGEDYFVNNFYGCKDEDGNSPSKAIFTKEDGRYEVLKVMEKILTPDYVLPGSNTYEMTTMQTKFLQGECAMMVTGGWITNEMKSVGGLEDFEMMKTPVVSSIIDKLDTVTSDVELRKVVSAVDAVTNGDKDVSEYQDGDVYKVDDLTISASDWECVRKARNTISSNYSGHSMFVPTYSNAKEGAKEFIKFIYSDEGYKIYTDTLHMPLPISLDSGETDISKWNDFEKAQAYLVETSEQTATSYIKGQHKIFYLGGASDYAGLHLFDKFCANNATDRLNATQAWEKLIDKIESSYENAWLANIGE